MLLTADIGNTSTVFGVFQGGTLKAHWRISTGRDRTADEYGVMLRGLFSSSGIDASLLTGAIACSVVPQADKPYREAAGTYLGVVPRFVGDDIGAGIPVLLDNPAEVGADRLVNAVAAFHALKRALIVVDIGTAVTLDYVTAAGEYAGGAIAPGPALALDSLAAATAKLPRVRLRVAPRAVGRSTEEAMLSGVFWGSVSLVDGLVERMAMEAGGEPAVIATGGYAQLFAGASERITEADEFLTLKGLRIIHEGKG